MIVQLLMRICVFMIVFMCAFDLFSQPGLIQQLNRGQYQVGFSSTIGFDDTQNYPYYHYSKQDSKKQPKPLLINVWYPAEYKSDDKKMNWGGYLDFANKDIILNDWLKRYKIYTEESLFTELLGKNKKEVDSSDKKLIDSFLFSPTTVVKNASHAKGKFPFIIYAQGAGGTIEDNAVFCALLASHGYVVIGSSFQHNGADYLGPQGPNSGIRDIIFLLNYAKNLKLVDYQKAGMMGHSLGAQKMIDFMKQGNTPFEALVSLETTQEYHSTENKLWDYYVVEAIRNANAVKGSFLFFTGPTAIHILADQFNAAERNYLTIPDLGHNDYISQGIQKRYLASKRIKSSDAYIQYQRTATKYVQINNATVLFFNAKLKGDSLEWEKMIHARQQNEFGNEMSFEKMTVGQKNYLQDFSENKIPTPRQIKFLVVDGKIDTVTQLLKNCWRKRPKAPIYEPSVAYPLILHLLSRDTTKAVRLYQTYVDLIGDKDIDELFLFWARVNKMRSLQSEAQKLLDALYILNPSSLEKIKRMVDQQKDD